MKRILIVDDEQLILHILTRALKCEGVEVNTASAGDQATEAIATGDYDLCLLDIFLPSVNGIEILKKVRESGLRTKIILMSAYETSEIQKMLDALWDKEVLFIPKPFDLPAVKALVHRALEEDWNPCSEPRHGQDGGITNRESRRFARRQSDETVMYAIDTLNGPDTQTVSGLASVLNVSDAGMCIRLSRLIEAGSVLRFERRQSRVAGIVRWILMDTGRPSCTAGIEFV